MSAELVKKLRNMTQAGILDCKKALQETGDDLEKATEFLRKKGLAKAVKKADREANDGLAAHYISDDGQKGALTVVNCETDFVARNENFQKLAANIAKQVAEGKPTDVDALLAAQAAFDAGHSVADSIKNVIATIGENITVREFAYFDRGGEPGFINAYIHHGGKIGVMIEFATSSAELAGSDDVKQVAYDIAMHVAAANPPFLKPDAVDSETINKEKEILKAQPDVASKPANIQDKIVEGRVSKFLAENCLILQPFVKNPDFTIEALLQDLGKKVGGTIDIVKFVRLNLGA